MRKRFFYHTITEQDEFFQVKDYVIDPETKEKVIDPITKNPVLINIDHLQAVKIKGKPYVYHKDLNLKVGDKVMIIRPGSVINLFYLPHDNSSVLNMEVDHRFDFLQHVRTIEAGSYDSTRVQLSEEHHGRRIIKKQIGNVLSHGLLLGMNEIADLSNFEESIEKYHTVDSVKLVNGYLNDACECMKKAEKIMDCGLVCDMEVC